MIYLVTERVQNAVALRHKKLAYATVICTDIIVASIFLVLTNFSTHKKINVTQI